MNNSHVGHDFKSVRHRALLFGLVVLILTCLDGFAGIISRGINIKTFGAVGDGKVLVTDAINQAITAANQAGGGTVILPSGRWLSGKIHLKSNVKLKISKKASIIPAMDAVYSEPAGSIEALIWGDSLENVEIFGGGVIQGRTGLTWDNAPESSNRCALALQRCRNVKIKDIKIRHGGGTAIQLISLDSLEMDGVKVESFFNKSPECSQGKDGVILDGCQHVYIHDCDFQAADDAFALKTRASGFRTVSKYIKIERCNFRSRNSSGIQLGSEVFADIRYIRISDVVIEHAGNAGIGLTINDSAVIDNIIFKDVLMRNVCTPFFILAGNRRGAGKIQNIRFENIEAKKISAIAVYSRHSPRGYWVSTVSGTADTPVENIVFKNINLHYPGGGSVEMAQAIPPESVVDCQPRCLGIRPAGGFYIRHARKIEFHGLNISYDKEDLRPAMFFDDVQGVNLSRVKLQRAAQVLHDVVLKNVHGLSVQNSQRLKVSEDQLPVLDATQASKPYFQISNGN